MSIFEVKSEKFVVKNLLKFSGRRKLTGRGKTFSLPKPQGGKHAFNPILCADQPVPQNHLSMAARKKTNAMDPDYIAGTINWLSFAFRIQGSTVLLCCY
jgi:hypothetical protein